MVGLNKKLSFRLTEREYGILEKIGDRYGLSVSDILRRVIYEYTESKGIVVYEWDYKKRQIEKVLFLLDSLHSICNSLKKHSVYAIEQMNKIKKFRNNKIFALEKKILRFRIKVSKRLIKSVDGIIEEMRKYINIMGKTNDKRKNRNIL